MRWRVQSWRGSCRALLGFGVSRPLTGLWWSRSAWRRVGLLVARPLVTSHGEVNAVAGDHHRRPGEAQQPAGHDVGEPVIAEENSGETNGDKPGDCERYSDDSGQ